MTDIAVISSGSTTPLPMGPAGQQGAIGTSGPAGPAGATGSIGPLGPAGPQGLQGAAGASGPAGPVGPQGAGGPAGPAGAPGPATPSLLTFRNRLHNASFSINQRQVSGTVTLGAGTYGHDRWRAGAAGCTYKFTVSGNITIITITSGSLQQVIENVNIEGGAYYLSWSGTALGRAIAGIYGGGTYAASGALTTGLAGGGYVTVEFGPGTLSIPQFEPQQSSQTGPTTFEQRPVGFELALCQRFYFRRWNTEASRTIAVLAKFASYPTGGLFALPVTMRASPSTKISAVGDFGISNYNGNTVTPLVTWYGSAPQADTNAIWARNGLIIDPSAVNGEGMAVAFCEMNATGWIEASADL